MDELLGNYRSIPGKLRFRSVVRWAAEVRDRQERYRAMQEADSRPLLGTQEVSKRDQNNKPHRKQRYNVKPEPVDGKTTEEFMEIFEEYYHCERLNKEGLFDALLAMAPSGKVRDFIKRKDDFRNLDWKEAKKIIREILSPELTEVHYRAEYINITPHPVFYECSLQH